MPAKPASRLHVADDLSAGASIAFSSDMAHRLRAVLRLKPGDHVALFNGRDGEWLARIESIERGAGAAVARERLRAQRERGRCRGLVFALIKRRAARMAGREGDRAWRRHAPSGRDRAHGRRAHQSRPARCHRAPGGGSRASASLCPRSARPALELVLAAWPARPASSFTQTGTAPPAFLRAAGPAAGPGAAPDRNWSPGRGEELVRPAQTPLGFPGRPRPARAPQRPGRTRRRPRSRRWGRLARSAVVARWRPMQRP